LKKNNAIPPWLEHLNLVTSTSYAASNGVRRDVGFLQHRRVNRTLYFTSIGGGGASDQRPRDRDPVVLLIVWRSNIGVNE